VLWYPTQAKKGLEWGTQRSLPVQEVPTQHCVLGYSQPDLSKLLVGAPAFMRGKERFSAP
jgi:hypothetical protein